MGNDINWPQAKACGGNAWDRRIARMVPELGTRAALDQRTLVTPGSDARRLAVGSQELLGPMRAGCQKSAATVTNGPGITA